MPRRKSTTVSPSQQKVLDVIASHLCEYGVLPSIREIAIALGQNHNAIKDKIEVLIRLGLLIRNEGKSRSYLPTQVKPMVFAKDGFIALVCGGGQILLPPAQARQFANMILAEIDHC